MHKVMQTLRIANLKYYILLGLLLCCSLVNGMQMVNPIHYGLRTAKNGEEKYYVLLKCHQEAVKKNCGVCYTGIKDIVLEIPNDATPIPLTSYTDFAGVRLKVKNSYKNLALFSISQKLVPIKSVKGIDIDRGVFSNYPELSRGKKLLVIMDENPWVENRRGYSYGAFRRDIMLITNGRASNKPVMSYGTPDSKLKAEYCNVSNDRVLVKNLAFVRDPKSLKMTMLIDLSNLYNVEITNILIETPNNDELYRDAAIKISNCVDVTLNDITIKGTYSLINHSGYGINLNNIYNLKVNRMFARAKWGVFGCNNLNTVTLNDCDINRFDIHCYGRDVFCKNTIFRNLYNQFSSLYGTLRFEGCHFVNSVPVLFESSYSAYTYFNLEIENCAIDVDGERPYLISTGNPAKLSERPRKALAKACWPDVKIRNLMVNLPYNTEGWNIFQLRGGAGIIHGITKIDIDGLIINGGGNSLKVRVSNKKMIFDRQLSVRVRNSNIEKVEN